MLNLRCRIYKQQAEEARRQDNQDEADDKNKLVNNLQSILADHVFQTDVSTQLMMPVDIRRKKIWKFVEADRAILFNVDLLGTGIDLPCCDCVFLHSPIANSNTALQRFGRCLRLNPACPTKVGTVAFPCPDPYSDLEPEEETRLLKLVPSKHDKQYDLLILCLQSMLDPNLKSLGRAFNAIGFCRGKSGGNGAIAGKDSLQDPSERSGVSSSSGGSKVVLHALLRNPSKHTPIDCVAMTEENMQWFQGAYQACSRNLFRLCFDDWLQVIKRWKLSLGQEVPDKYKSPPRNGEYSKYQDEVFGVVNLGVWLNKRKCQARTGNETCEAELLQIGQCLGLEELWWKSITTRPKTLILEEYVELYKGWKVWYDTLPVKEHHKSGMPPMKGPKQAYNGINLGIKLNALKQEARKLEKEAAAKRQKKVKEAAAHGNGDGNDLTISDKEDGKERVDKKDPRHWLDCIGEVFSKPRGWWKSAEDDDKKEEPETPEEWKELCKRWKAKQSKEDQESNKMPPATRENKGTGKTGIFEDEIYGVIALGNKITNMKVQARGTGTVSAETSKKAALILDAIGEVFGQVAGWWKTDRKPKTDDEFVAIFKRWKDYNDKLKVGDKMKCPTGKPVNKGPRATFNDPTFGSVCIGATYLTTWKNKARKGDAVIATRLNRIYQEVFGESAESWKSAEDDDKKEPETPEEWKELCKRWKAKQSKEDQESNKMPPATRENKGTGKTGIFEDEIYGVIALGNKITNMKVQARGTGTVSAETSKKAALILDAIGEVFGQEAGWWRTFQKPKTDDEFVAIFKRWKDYNDKLKVGDKMKCPTGKPVKSGPRATFNDPVFGPVLIGRTYLTTWKTKARKGDAVLATRLNRIYQEVFGESAESWR